MLGGATSMTLELVEPAAVSSNEDFFLLKIVSFSTVVQRKSEQNKI